MSSLQLFQLFLVAVSVQLMAVTFSEAKVFSRCDLAKTLLNTYQFNRADLANWVCLVEAESGRNTAAIGSPNSNGSRDYGLFQINSIYWCSGGPGSKYNECNVSCKALTNDDISDDVKCVRKIFGRHGFSAWYGWINKCKGKNVSSYIAGCGV